MNARRDDTRQLILDTGHRLIAGKGFSSVGLAEILAYAGVPKGSFYHYFESKEQYGQALLESYFDSYVVRLDALLGDPALAARERLIRYWQQWVTLHEADDDGRKCLVVKLSAEVADLSDTMRITLRDGTERVIERLARCIEAGRLDGSVSVHDAHGAARTLYPLWLGASLLAKLHRNSDALREAMLATLAILDGPADAHARPPAAT